MIVTVIRPASYEAEKMNIPDGWTVRQLLDRMKASGLKLRFGNGEYVFVSDRLVLAEGDAVKLY